MLLNRVDIACLRLLMFHNVERNELIPPDNRRVIANGIYAARPKWRFLIARILKERPAGRFGRLPTVPIKLA